MRSFVQPFGALVFAALTVALDPVEVYGNKFFNKDGSQFFMKGTPLMSDLESETSLVLT